MFAGFHGNTIHHSQEINLYFSAEVSVLHYHCCIFSFPICSLNSIAAIFGPNNSFFLNIFLHSPYKPAFSHHCHICSCIPFHPFLLSLQQSLCNSCPDEQPRMPIIFFLSFQTSHPLDSYPNLQLLIHPLFPIHCRLWVRPFFTVFFCHWSCGFLLNCCPHLHHL